MSNVIGNKEWIEWGKSLQPGNKVCFINWEAINELPPQFESVITTIAIDIQKDFTEVSKKYMPTTDLYYKIAEACGVSGDTSKVEAFYENIDINPMLCKPIYEEPTYRKLKTGVTVTKQSKRMTEDGSFILSSPCSNIYNVWDRCTEEWLKEEKYTEGYTKPPKFGKYKYQTTLNRQFHFASEMKFAHQKAETKAYCKTIRELAGLPTAFERADLSTGVLMFSKVRRSAKALQVEQAAYLSNISQGNNNQKNLLFDDDKEEAAAELIEQDTDINVEAVPVVDEPVSEPIDEPVSESVDESVNKPIDEPVSESTQDPTLLDVLLAYRDTIGVSATVDKMIAWLQKVGNDCMTDDNIVFYNKALANLKELESDLKTEDRITHNLY